MSLMSWGDRYLAPDGPPLLPLHRNCGGRLIPQLTCVDCGASLGAGEVELTAGPSAALDNRHDRRLYRVMQVTVDVLRQRLREEVARFQRSWIC